MKPLTDDMLRRLREVRREIGNGWRLTQVEISRLEAEWEPRVQPDHHDTSERFVVTRPDGTTTGAHAPRWFFHLVGLCHRSAHIGLLTPSGLVAVQRRAPTKADWPDAWDMAVAGHVPLREDGSEMGYEEGAWKEIEEELGLREADQAITLAEGKLVPIGAPFYTFDMDESRNPPFHNAEVHQLFGAALTAEGLARLKPDPEELSGVYFCPPEEAWDLLVRDKIASGLRFTLPRFLDWMART